MNDIQNPNDRLTLQRLHANYVVAEGHPNMGELRERLDQIAGRELPRALATALTTHRAALTASSNEGADAGGIWLIRRLQVAVDLRLGWETEHIAQEWARQIETSLVESIRQDDSENVIWYPTRPAYMARFLSDLAHGAAWDRWQYAEFDGLRLLPLSAALRTAISEQPGVGLEALGHLSLVERRFLLQKLTLQDARRLLDRLAMPVEPNRAVLAPVSLWQSLWAAWQKLGSDPLDEGDEIRQSIELLVTVNAGGVSLATATIRAAAQALVHLARHLAQIPAAQIAPVLTLLMGGDLATLYTQLGAGAAERLAPLRQCPPEILQEMAKEVGGRHSPASAAPSSFGEIRTTIYGGAFLLFPLLDELPLDEATGDWPEAGDVPAATLIRFLLLVKCFGAGSAAHAYSDLLLRDMMQIPGGLGMAAIAEWQQQVTPQRRQRLLQAMIDWQRSRGAIRDELYGLARLTDVRGSVFSLLFDGARGLWLALTPQRPPAQKTVRAQWQRAGIAPDHLLCDRR